MEQRELHWWINEPC